MSLIRKHVAVLQAWACLDLVKGSKAIWRLRALQINRFRPLLIYASLHENPSEYPRKPHTAESLPNILVSDSIGVPSFVFT